MNYGLVELSHGLNAAYGWFEKRVSIHLPVASLVQYQHPRHLSAACWPLYCLRVEVQSEDSAAWTGRHSRLEFGQVPVDNMCRHRYNRLMCFLFGADSVNHGLTRHATKSPPLWTSTASESLEFVCKSFRTSKSSDCWICRFYFHIHVTFIFVRLCWPRENIGST